MAMNVKQKDKEQVEYLRELVHDINESLERYLHLTREWGWNDTEVRDAMYVETKQRGWCRE